jgi:hypothetical protein
MATNSESRSLINKHGYAWVWLTVALAIHVTDEASNDFLSVYNPIVNKLVSKYPYLPLPTFTFSLWITGLIIAIAALFALSLAVFHGKKFTIYFSFFYGGLMLLNGLTHIAGSFALGRVLPGTWSAPLLIIASLYLLVTTIRVGKRMGILKEH